MNDIYMDSTKCEWETFQIKKCILNSLDSVPWHPLNNTEPEQRMLYKPSGEYRECECVPTSQALSDQGRRNQGVQDQSEGYIQLHGKKEMCVEGW